MFDISTDQIHYYRIRPFLFVTLVPASKTESLVNVYIGYVWTAGRSERGNCHFQNVHNRWTFGRTSPKITPYTQKYQYIMFLTLICILKRATNFSVISIFFLSKTELQMQPVCFGCTKVKLANRRRRKLVNYL